MEDAFDKSINDAFSGVGQSRSERCGQYRALFERLCTGTKFTVDAVWEQDGINVSVSFPDDEFTTTGIVFMPDPDPARVEAQAQASLQAFIDFVDSPLFQKRGTEPLA